MFKSLGLDPWRVIVSSVSYLQVSDPALMAPWTSIPETSKVIGDKEFSSKMSSEVEGTVTTPSSSTTDCIIMTLELAGKVTSSPDNGTYPCDDAQVDASCHKSKPPCS
jgi:hypothetical protein